MAKDLYERDHQLKQFILAVTKFAETLKVWLIVIYCCPLYGESFIAPSKGSKETNGKPGGNISGIKTTWSGSILSHLNPFVDRYQNTCSD
jgi:hypothetical protein